MRKLLRGIAQRTPGIGGLLAARRKADQQRTELRDAVGARLLTHWKQELHSFEAHRANRMGVRTGPIAQVTWSISRGGAAGIARALHVAVGQELGSLVFHGNAAEATDDSAIQAIQTDALSKSMIEYGWAQSMRGFCSSTTGDLINSLIDSNVALAHLHNCHPDYFNLLELPRLSTQIPTVWTLHDEYAYTGHCAFTLGCDGWTKGCTPCPYVTRYVELSADRAGEHFRLKREIYDKARLTVVCVSNWLANRVRASILNQRDIRIIPNGVDATFFRPKCQGEARAKLNLPSDGLLIGYCADGGAANPWKGGGQLPHIAQGLGLRNCHFVCVGGNTKQARGGFIDLGYLPERQSMVDVYNAVDIWLHPSEADSFGLVVAEAMACGTPVISSSAGALPELVEHQFSGILVEAGDTGQFQYWLRELATSQTKRSELGVAGREKIESKFSEHQMIEAYLNLYAELLSESADGTGPSVHS